ncbi:MAG TPA: PKD domain-containing protein, partial [Flavobacteriales bacterium]|nr:PKD domain-containing protein [Flavobacteriales bacterium]
MHLSTLISALILASTATAQPICDELQAGFTYETTPNGVAFTNTTTGAGGQTTWYWSFGDASTSMDGSPFHTYAASGEYEVCLYALSIYTNGGGSPTTCVDTTCTTVVIGGGNPCDGLTACFVPNNYGNGNFLFDNCSTNNGNAQ